MRLSDLRALGPESDFQVEGVKGKQRDLLPVSVADLVGVLLEEGGEKVETWRRSLNSYALTVYDLEPGSYLVYRIPE